MAKDKSKPKKDEPKVPLSQQIKAIFSKKPKPAKTEYAEPERDFVVIEGKGHTLGTILRGSSKCSECSKGASYRVSFSKPGDKPLVLHSCKKPKCMIATTKKALADYYTRHPKPVDPPAA